MLNDLNGWLGGSERGIGRHGFPSENDWRKNIWSMCITGYELQIIYFQHRLIINTYDTSKEKRG